jgi:hypothetical protein
VSAKHEHDEERTVLYSALKLPIPEAHDQDLAAATELLRLYGAEAA